MAPPRQLRRTLRNRTPEAPEVVPDPKDVEIEELNNTVASLEDEIAEMRSSRNMQFFDEMKRIRNRMHDLEYELGEERREHREKTATVTKQNTAMKKSIKAMENKIKLLKAVSGTQNAKKEVDKMQKLTIHYKKNMHEAHRKLRAKEERADGEVKPWRLCEICDHPYTSQLPHSPRVLKCGHTVCYSCLRNLYNVDDVQCPFDRISTVCEYDELDQLPKNYAVLQM